MDSINTINYDNTWETTHHRKNIWSFRRLSRFNPYRFRIAFFFLFFLFLACLLLNACFLLSLASWLLLSAGCLVMIIVSQALRKSFASRSTVRQFPATGPSSFLVEQQHKWVNEHHRRKLASQQTGETECLLPYRNRNKDSDLILAQIAPPEIKLLIPYPWQQSQIERTIKWITCGVQ